MKVWGSLAVAVAIALPAAPAAAQQTIAMRDLGGTWVQTSAGARMGGMGARRGGRNGGMRRDSMPACDSAACKPVRTLTLRADSTFTMTTTVNGKAWRQGRQGRWSLSGDMLTGIFRQGSARIALNGDELKTWRQRNGSEVEGPTFKRSSAAP